ncbi:S24/S26 family peptidase [Streptococcus sp. NLN64]|uniref:S24/S26 family peptidase n=1 Tax=Streptococcus sp. NLN64 TaxID=2822799 RepID=UPI0018CA3B33|nr:S24/S26 family peptidase [Streptococcus sp. NLN64]MBG9368166.1 S24/S26 family peptidase [Streptococcus sp. NLN64]
MQKRSIEEHLAVEGHHILQAQGNSMYPALRNGDLVTLESLDSFGEIHVGDIVLYRRRDRILVLHRVARIQNGALILNGDNCTYFEYPDADQVIAVLVNYQRRGRTADFRNMKSSLYRWFWCKPWILRFFILKVYRKLRRGRIHGTP